MAGEAQEARGVGDAQFGGAVPGQETDDRRVDSRRRPECGGRDVEEALHIGVHLRLHAQVAVIARAGLGRQARRHFLLHQENRARHRNAERQHFLRRKHFLNDRRGCVVRQVAGDGGGSPLAQIGLEGVGFHHGEPRFGLKFRAQHLNQRGVNFDRDHTLRPRQQPFGQRAAARADLDDDGLAVGTCGARDAFKRGAFDEEMLAKPLAGHEAAG